METVYAAGTFDVAAGPTTPTNAVGNTPTTWTTNTGNVSWGYGVYTLTTPINPVIAGTGTLRLFVRARPDASSTPVVRAQTHNALGVVETLPDQTVTSTTGQWVSWPIDQSQLVGGVIRIGVQADPGGGKPADRDTVQLAVIEATLVTLAPTGTIMKAWTGSVWQTGVLKRWTGTVWAPAVVKRWTGTAWVEE